MISGVARTADGMPLAGVQVSLDYKESVWLGQQVTRHKAKGVTDNEGNYRLYFELRDDELRDGGNDASVARNFYLTIDLSSLSEDMYIMPKDIKSDNDGQKLLFITITSILIRASIILIIFTSRVSAGLT